MIEIIDIHKSFGDTKVLTGVNLTINQGETITIIGGSGCGKSVLLKHIVALLKPDKGNITIDGKSIVNNAAVKEISSLQKKFGFLFQGAALFDSLTVSENVAFGLRNLKNHNDQEINRIVKERLEMVGLHNAGHLKPSELSGGMRKRVGLARAIAYDPEYILYDEPTTGLDPIMADVINDLIINLNKRLKITSVVVTHDMISAYKVSDRIAMLYNGKIIEIGTPGEIQNTSNEIVKQFITGKSEGPINNHKDQK